MIRINLIRERAPRGSRVRPSGSWTVVMLTIALLPVVHFMQGATLASLEERRAKLVAEVELRRNTIAEPVNSRTDRPTAKHPLGAAMTAERLRSLASAASEELWVVLYRQRSAEVTVKGIALNDQAVDSFAGRLSQAEGFGRVEITETVLREPKDRSPSLASEPGLYEFSLFAEPATPADCSQPAG